MSMLQKRMQGLQTDLGKALHKVESIKELVGKMDAKEPKKKATRKIKK